MNRRGFPHVPYQTVRGCGRSQGRRAVARTVVREENRGIRVTALDQGSRLAWYLRLETQPEDFPLGWLLHDFVPAR